MSINVQLLQTMMQLQALNNMNSSMLPGSATTMDSTDTFSTLLAAIMGDGSDQDTVTSPFNTLLMGNVNPMTQPVLEKNETDPKDYDGYITEAAATYNVDPKLIRSVIRHESNFNPASVSSAGAIGLMQLMPGTARGLGVTDPFDPKQNIEGGTKYLRHLLDTFDNNKALAIAAYNAGPGNVKKYNGIPPFQETQHYVQRVLNSYMS